MKFSYLHWKYYKHYKISIQGGPERTQHLRSMISRKRGTEWNRLCAILRIEYFFQQNYNKIINVEEGFLISWPFCEAMPFSKFATSVTKVKIYVPKIFHCLVSPGIVSALALKNEDSINKEKHSLRNSPVLQSGEATQRNSSYLNSDFWYKIHFENDIISEKWL